MKIMVFDVPAETGGALAILSEFYNDIKKSKDKSINWIFVLSTPTFEETENIKILRFPWVKKSWLHRLLFDNVFAPKIIKKYGVDKVFSLQNVVVPRTNIDQSVYIHQPLPFVDYKFTFRENKQFWTYQNIISRNIIKSIKNANQIIVQTNWFKKACSEKTGVNPDKISVIPPKININIDRYFNPTERALTTFFYPSSPLIYKNHKVIVDACKILKEQNITGYNFIFTLNGNENEHISKLYDQVKQNNLPVEFIGEITREEVFAYYNKSILLFPSYIETFGLPMLEAKMHNGAILASDCPFSREILGGYENAYFFDPHNPNELATLIKAGFNYTNNNLYDNKEKDVKADTISLIDLIRQL